MAQVALLVVTVLVVVLGHRHVRAAAAVLGGVVVGFAAGVLHLDPSADAVRALGPPVAFLVAAVPMAVLLAHVGFFDEVAARLPAGPRLAPALWALAAVVTTVCNLDAAIVLLTPLYLRVARRHGFDPFVLSAIPVLLASLASSALPVSNLTNLIAAERLDLGAADFLVHLGPPSLAATIVGWFAFRPLVRATSFDRARVDRPAVAPALGHPLAWRAGVPAVVVLLVGFTAGDRFGVPAWAVAATVVAGLVACTRHVPWRAVPVDAIVVACGLAVLATAASPHLGLERVLRGDGAGAALRVVAVGAGGSVLTNNLPALLVMLPLAGRTVWPLLLGVNVGPVLWMSGSLAGLLWADLVRHGGVPVSAGRYARLGLRVGGPALVAATSVLVLGQSFGHG